MGLSEAITGRIDQFDHAYSRFRPDSLVTHMASQAGTHNMPADAHRMLEFYEQLYRITGGKVTPLIGATMVDAGYDASYSFRPKASLATAPHWDDVISYDTHSLTLTRPVLLDFGAAGKGYLVDLIAGLLSDAGLHDYLINAGGDIAHRGDTSVIAGLESPFDTSQAIGTVPLHNQAIAASAGTKRKWQHFTHIIDPQSRTSPQDIVATWVIAADTMTADGLATALFFAAPETLRTHFDFQYAVLRRNARLSYSDGFNATLFNTKDKA
jgi:thiamine biosynthesis lipoprotein